MTVRTDPVSDTYAGAATAGTNGAAIASDVATPKSAAVRRHTIMDPPSLASSVVATGIKVLKSVNHFADPSAEYTQTDYRTTPDVVTH